MSITLLQHISKTRHNFLNCLFSQLYFDVFFNHKLFNVHVKSYVRNKTSWMWKDILIWMQQNNFSGYKYLEEDLIGIGRLRDTLKKLEFAEDDVLYSDLPISSVVVIYFSILINHNILLDFILTRSYRYLSEEIGHHCHLKIYILSF